MRDWEEVPATVLKADFKSQDPESDPVVSAKYRYSYGGQDYEGTRVEIAQSPQFISSFQQQMALELKGHVSNGTPTTAFVNPADPAESVLYPQFNVTYLAYRLGVIAALILAGAAFVLSVSRYFRNEHDRLIRQQSHPDEPWMWRGDWASQVIATSSYKYAWWFVAFAATYILVALPISLFMLREQGQEILSITGIILMVVGWGLFNAARLQLKAGRIFRGAEFRMSSVPGLIGGSLAGAVVLPRKSPDETKFRVVLECTETERSKTSDDDTSTSSGERVIWRDMVTVEKTIAIDNLSATAIPVYFAVPFDCQATDVTETATIRWRLKAGIEESNFHRYAAFVVPVYKTAESSRNFKPDPTVMQPYEAAVDAKQALARLCRIEPLANGQERYRFSYFDSAVFAIALVAIAICAGGVAAIFYFQFHPAWALLPGGFGLMFFVGLTLMCLWGSSLELDRDHLTVTSGYAPFRKRYELQLSDVLGVDIEKEHSVHEQDHFCVRVKIGLPIPENEIDTSGLSAEELTEEMEFLRNVKYTKTLVIVKRLERRNHAEIVGDWLRQKLSPQAAT